MFRVLTLTAIALILMSGPALAGDAAKAKKKKGDKVTALFKKLDADNDGKLSKTEFAKIKEQKKAKADAAKKPAKAGKGAKKTDALFTKLDTNSDGFLTLDEFKKMKEAKKAK